MIFSETDTQVLVVHVDWEFMINHIANILRRTSASHYTRYTWPSATTPTKRSRRVILREAASPDAPAMRPQRSRHLSLCPMTTLEPCHLVCARAASRTESLGDKCFGVLHHHQHHCRRPKHSLVSQARSGLAPRCTHLAELQMRLTRPDVASLPLYSSREEAGGHIISERAHGQLTRVGVGVGTVG